MKSTGREFAKSYVLPALFLFAVPSIGYWFAGHEVRTLDERYRALVIEQVQADEALTAEAREQVLGYFRQVVFSETCRSKGPAPLSEEAMKEVCSSYDYPTLAKQVSAFSLGLGLLSVLVVVLCGAVSFISRGSQYRSFLVGWHYLRVASTLQAFAQGAITVWLSFAMTALWLNFYSIKLILAVGFIVAAAAIAVVRAIFQRTGSPLYVEGELIDQKRSPELWLRIRRLCTDLGTEPPTQIIGGIDDNFFVTEFDVSAGNQLYRGRTLFVSLAMLRVLSRDEADAVLAHEMAHFSGGDTEHSKKLGPVMERFRAYLVALHMAVLSRPVSYFMQFYWAIVQLSVKRSSREREFRADAIAKEQTSPDAMARALLKIAAYCSYRRRVEGQLFSKDEKHAELGIGARVAAGFGGYALSDGLMADLEEAHFPHPFDSHPPLFARIEALGVAAARDRTLELLKAANHDTWLSSIKEADETEHRLWSFYETRFAAVHDKSLAYRYLPATPEQEAHVVRYFPKVEIPGGKAGSLVVDHRGLRFADSGEGVDFSEIDSVKVSDLVLKKYFEVYTKRGSRTEKFSVCLSDLKCDKLTFLSLFNDYYGRHQAAVDAQRLG